MYKALSACKRMEMGDPSTQFRHGWSGGNGRPYCYLENVHRESCATGNEIKAHVEVKRTANLMLPGYQMNLLIYDSGYHRRTVYLDGLFNDDKIYLMNR